MTDPHVTIEQVLTLALTEAHYQRSPILGMPHLFIALTKLDGATAAALRAGSHEPKRVRDGLRWAMAIRRPTPSLN